MGPFESPDGVFYPQQIEEMEAELKRGDVPGESPLDREARAADILNRWTARIGKAEIGGI